MAIRAHTGASQLPRVRTLRNETNAGALIGQIGTLQGNAQRALSPLKKRRNRLRKELAEINQEIARTQERFARVIEGRAEKVFAFAEENKETLTKRFHAKTIKLGTGRFSWRLGPVSAQVTDATELMLSLRERNLLDQYLRQQPTFNLAALRQEKGLLEELRGIEGVRVTRFSIVPDGSERRLVRVVGPDEEWTSEPLKKKESLAA
jgi:phage host-nuclease inhibitor protein Gam